MKRPRQAAFASFFIAALASPCLASDASWASSVAEAMKQGKALGKPIMIEFTSPYCGPCQKMEREIFSKPEFKALMGQFAKAKANVMDPKMKALMKSYGFKQLPSFLYMRPNGTVVQKISDVPRLEHEFRADLKYVLKREKAIASAKKMVAVSPSSGSARYRLALAYLDANEPALALEQFKKVVAAGGKGKHVAGASYYLAKAYAKQGQLDKAAQLFDQVAKLDPKNALKLTDKALLERGKIAMKRGKFGPAYRYFAKIIKVYDQDKKILAEAQAMLGECQNRMRR